MLALLGAGPASSEVKLELVKYDALTAAVRKQRGKVVVVDFWADFCLPCKREFPKLVELDRKHRDRGLVVVSVALDEPNLAARERVRTFLDRQRATFANYLLDERTSFWQDKLKIDGPPLVFVFNRRGELAKKFTDDDGKHLAIEQLVVRLLNEQVHERDAGQGMDGRFGKDTERPFYFDCGRRTGRHGLAGELGAAMFLQSPADHGGDSTGTICLHLAD